MIAMNVANECVFTSDHHYFKYFDPETTFSFPSSSLKQTNLLIALDHRWADLFSIYCCSLSFHSGFSHSFFLTMYHCIFIILIDEWVSKATVEKGDSAQKGKIHAKRNEMKWIGYFDKACEIGFHWLLKQNGIHTQTHIHIHSSKSKSKCFKRKT